MWVAGFAIVKFVNGFDICKPQLFTSQKSYFTAESSTQNETISTFRFAVFLLLLRFEPNRTTENKSADECAV